MTVSFSVTYVKHILAGIMCFHAFPYIFFLRFRKVFLRFYDMTTPIAIISGTGKAMNFKFGQNSRP